MRGSIIYHAWRALDAIRKEHSNNFENIPVSFDWVLLERISDMLYYVSAKEVTAEVALEHISHNVLLKAVTV